MGRGDGAAEEELLERLYAELLSLAKRQMRHASPGQTLQPTALVHEAYLRLAGEPGQDWKNRKHFFFVAARAMHDVVVERARRRARKKRGGDRTRVDLNHLEVAFDASPEDVLALDEALCRLEEHLPRAAQIVRLRFFAGLTEEETAAALELSPSTVAREWRLARARLQRDLLGESPP